MLFKEKLKEIEALNVQRTKTEEELVEYKSKCSELSGQVAIMNGRVREMEQALKKAKKK